MDSCSFCHTINDADQKVCVKCGHDAHVPRVDCSCYSCSAFPAFVTGGFKAQRAVDRAIEDAK